MRLQGKVAVITAAGSGTGRAAAVIFAREGAKVIAADIVPQAGEETVRLVREGGGEATFVQIDAGKVADMRRLIDTAVGKYGTLNILWNHAGIPGPGTLEDTEEEAFDRAQTILTKGGFFAAKFAVPHLRKAGGGSIIFTSSISGIRGLPWSPSYSMAKGGLVTLTMSLALALARYNIRVNCICPGPIDSPMLRVFVDRTGKLKGDEMENAMVSAGRASPMRRLARPEEVAYAGLFLASDEASFITGVALPVDGGLSAR